MNDKNNQKTAQNAPHVLVVEARFYGHIADMQAQGAIAALEKAGATYDRVSVPGALEIPAAIAFAAGDENKGQRYDAFVALGCVIRGETTHYDTVANESARGIMQLSVEKNLAIGNGILTVEN
ncbi:MAG TPA: 6,7-dimethyl-8-ribityllumazine synthase, partial [Alphaproteobacteria bacterium]|nr:6,7-dimethyl-8-ribityllumazine synthase [Alphaproteobacteria bacterium]